MKTKNLQSKHQRLLEAAQADNAKLRRVLEFYANPDTYFAIGFLPDRPCGDFVKDFSQCTDAIGNPTVKPGKRARKALGWKD